MSEFIKPEGINFSCKEKLSVIEFSKVLCQIVNYIRQIDSYKKFERYDDWWQHDGLHFYRNSISPQELSRMVGSPKSLSEAVPGDRYVFIGIAPANNIWYLRFYLSDEDGENDLITHFDITFPNETAERFKAEIVSKLNLKIKEQDAQTFYQSIIS